MIYLYKIYNYIYSINIKKYKITTCLVYILLPICILSGLTICYQISKYAPFWERLFLY